MPTLSDENPSGYGELVFWTCWQRCDPSAASTCREGYVCMPSGGSATQGRCTPDCRVAESLGARVCTGMCSQSTGLCQ